MAKAISSVSSVVPEKCWPPRDPRRREEDAVKETISLTEEWQQLSELDELRTFTVPVPNDWTGKVRRVVYKLEGGEVWARWEDAEP